MELKRATAFKIKVRLADLSGVVAPTVQIQKQGGVLAPKVLVVGDWTTVDGDVYDLLLSADDTDTNGFLFVLVTSGTKKFRGLYEVREYLEADTYTLVQSVQTLIETVQGLVDALPTNPVLVTDGRLNNLDVAVSTRAAPADVDITVNPTPVTVNPALTQAEHDHLMALENPDLTNLDVPVSTRATPGDVTVTVEPTPVTVNPTLTGPEHDHLMALQNPDLTPIAKTTDVTAARDAINTHTDEAVATIPGGGGGEGGGLTQAEHDHLLSLQNPDLSGVAKTTDLAPLARLDVTVSTRATVADLGPIAKSAELAPLAKEATLTAIKGAGWVPADDNLHTIRGAGGAGGGGGGLTPTQEAVLYDIQSIVERFVPAGDTGAMPIPVGTGASYDMQVSLAARLIKAKGRPVEVVTFTDPAPEDPTKPWDLGPPVETVEATMGVFLSSKKEDDGEPTDHHADDDLVHKERRRILIAGEGLTRAPNAKGEIRVDGVRWGVKAVVPVSPGGTDILYTVTVVR